MRIYRMRVINMTVINNLARSKRSPNKDQRNLFRILQNFSRIKFIPNPKFLNKKSL